MRTCGLMSPAKEVHGVHVKGRGDLLQPAERDVLLAGKEAEELCPAHSREVREGGEGQVALLGLLADVGRHASAELGFAHVPSVGAKLL